MAEVPSASSPPPQQKLSRYRSQRKQQHPFDDNAQQQVTPQRDDTATDDSVARSKSRYRRKPSIECGARPATANDQEQISVWPPSNRTSPAKPQIYQTQPIVRPPSQRQPGGAGVYGERYASPPAQLGAVDSRRVKSAELDWAIEEDRRRRLQERYSVRRKDGTLSSPAQIPAVTTTPVGGGLFPPPQAEPVRSAAPTSDEIRATKSMSALPRYSDDEDEDEEPGGCFGLFKRKRVETAPQIEKPTLSKPTATKEPPTIKPGGGGIVPGTDAPVSAVNAGDRRVLVECGKSKILFPVTPTTTPVDIIKGASASMSERITINSAVLLESFGTVGIQRPLRRYEHVRDVLNSWDTDRQNSLILIDPGTGTSEAELSLAGVPRGKPGDEGWTMWFSQKVGRWEKRFITLRSDGQITAQKDPDKPKDAANVCHLSDFDIYTPTQEKIKKKIRPPKKLCFAIKSQQKTSMFESTHDFVHFFCTNDRATGDAFYRAVQGWRSWYLVNVMGEGKKNTKAAGAGLDEIGGGLEKEVEYLPTARDHRAANNSMDSGYQLGSFKPLLDGEKVNARPGMREGPTQGFTKSSSQFDTTISPERRTSTARRRQQQQQHTPGSIGNKAQLADDEPLVNLGRQASVDRRRPSVDQTKISPEEFLSTGLLGRTYSQRRQEYEYNNNNNSNEDYSGRRSMDGCGGAAIPKRTHSTHVQQHQHKTTGSGELQRSNSRAREMPKPLVDLTPQYREPPQHSKKGRGYLLENLGPGRLVDAATSPEDPLGIPPATDWRSRNLSASPQQQQQLLNRTNSLQRSTPPSKSVRRPATSREAGGGGGFTGEGLLAGSQAQSGWGSGERGRGVMAARNGGPMVDLNEPSKFVQGSLLNRVERDQGGTIPAPVIDRSREED